MNATFFQRLFAYLIDTIVITIILSIIMVGFTNSKVDGLTEDGQFLLTSYTEGDLSINEYYAEYSDWVYEYQQADIVKNIVNFLVIIAYFIVFQFLNNGQTIGKKLMNIRIKAINDKKINIGNYIVRGLFIYSIVSLLGNISLVYLLDSSIYVFTYSALTIIESIFVIVSIILILYRKDKRGLHDLMANTKVVTDK